MAGDINGVLRQEELRPGRPYFSPAHIVSADDGQFGTPWWMSGQINYDPWLAVTVSAPPRPHKGSIDHQVQGIQNSGVDGSGQAPTSGIYTGVEETCQ